MVTLLTELLGFIAYSFLGMFVDRHHMRKVKGHVVVDKRYYVSFFASRMGSIVI
mgnify:CR=1 FL=1|jgi:hypothetical protein